MIICLIFQKDFSKYEKVLIKSNAKIILNDDVHDHKPNDNENSVATIAYSKMSAVVKQQVPLWLYVASVVGGLVIFSICLLAFWIVRLKMDFYICQKLIF